MRPLQRMAALVFGIMALAACGDATPDSATTGVSASLSASAVFDAAGTWKVESHTCSAMPVPSQFDNAVQNTASDIQTFRTETFQAGNVIVQSSEGTLNAQTGAYTLCYASTLSDCQMSCTGTASASNHADLTCTNASGDLICTMALQK